MLRCARRLAGSSDAVLALDAAFFRPRLRFERGPGSFRLVTVESAKQPAAD
jgi:hypothetical protein